LSTREISLQKNHKIPESVEPEAYKLYMLRTCASHRGKKLGFKSGLISVRKNMIKSEENGKEVYSIFSQEYTIEKYGIFIKLF